MTTLDTEWESLIEKFKPTVAKPNSEQERKMYLVKRDIVEEIWQAQKPVLLKELSSRDTYWKERVREKEDLLDDMWGLICNVNGGVIDKEKEEWYQAFLRMRNIDAVINQAQEDGKDWQFSHAQPVNEYECVAVFEKWIY